jgi:hypothetical protein
MHAFGFRPALVGIPAVSLRFGLTRMSPLVRFRSSSGHSSPRSLPVTRSPGTSPGISCRSTHAFRRSPHTPRASTLRVKGRVQGSFALFAVYSSFGLAGLFHPANALRLHLQGLPSRVGDTDSSSASGRLVVILRTGPASRHCSTRESAPMGRMLIRAQRPIPSWFFPSPGRDRCATRHDSSPHRSSHVLHEGESTGCPSDARSPHFGVSLAQQVRRRSRDEQPS